MGGAAQSAPGASPALAQLALTPNAVPDAPRPGGIAGMGGLLARATRNITPDRIFNGITGGFALALLAIFAFILVILAQGAWPAMKVFGPGFIWSKSWDPPGQNFGALPYLYGTVVSSLIALLVAVPVSVGAALALVTLIPRRLASGIGMVVELLAAVPSIVFGVWGVVVIVPFVKSIGGERTFGPSLLAAGLVLAVMVLPIITAVTRDLLRTVPLHQREAALALGATRWEVGWQVILPHARPGIAAAVILGLGRAIGETMAVVMVIGNQPVLEGSLFQPASTLASVIANEFGDPSGPLHYPALILLGLIMLALSLAMSLSARAIVKRLSRRMGGMS